jgi:DNA-directed RNA polymerase I and III subunit RPAC1
MFDWSIKTKFIKKSKLLIENKQYENFIKKKIICQLRKKSLFSITDFRNTLKIDIIKMDKDDMILDISSLDLSFMNGIRRILLSEVTTVCIDKVFFYKNSSVLNDEILSHRLGLLPLFITSHLFGHLSDSIDNFNKKIIFELDIQHPVNKFKKISVYSRFLKLKIYGIHFSWLKNFILKPVFKDILIAKLNPGQQIKCECHCKIGYGEKHAKFSPVGTAFYRIFPRIKLVEEIFERRAIELAKKCPVNVFEIEEIFMGIIKRLYVSKPEFCTLCRECIKLETKEKTNVRLGRIREKTTFIIESTGVFSPERLFHRAICLLTGKCSQSMSVLFKNFKIPHVNNLNFL